VPYGGRVPTSAPARPRMTAFDLDDTLAPSKAPLPDPVREALIDLLGVTQVCVISGGQIEQFRTQLVGRLGALPDALAARLHLMPTCGTQYWRLTADGLTCVYAEDLTDDEKSRAMAAVEQEAKRLGLWAERTWGPALEDRGSQITFSALGQQAPLDEKKAWDPTGEKKNRLRAAVQERVPDLEVRSGGSTSVDITRQGIDKAYGMRRLAELTGVGFEDTLFVGDRLDPDGNDYPVKALGVPTVAVEGWEDTVEVIRGVVAAF
jgi:phosphomannomutase